MKPMPLGACSDCDALWRNFAHATAEHVKLLMDSQMAAVKQDAAHTARAEELISAAEARRAAAREAVYAHESTAHDGMDSTTT